MSSSDCIDSEPGRIMGVAARRWGSFLLFFGALALYLLTLSCGPFPGEPAAITRTYSGLSDFPPLSHPLYLLIARLLHHLPWGGIADRLNVFSAVCAALAVAMLFRRIMELGYRTRTDVLDNPDMDEDGTASTPAGPNASVSSGLRQERSRIARFQLLRLQLFAGFVGATFLMVCAPFWYVATRAHYAALDTVLLLLVSGLFMRYLRGGRSVDALLCAFAYGIAITETATAILGAPIFAGLLLWAMKVHGRFVLHSLDIGEGASRLRLPFLAGIVLLVGLFPYYVHAAWLADTPSSVWREALGLRANLLEIWREQYRTLQVNLPKVGWLLPVLMTLGPLVLLALATKASYTRGRQPVATGLCALLVGLSGCILFDAPFTPWDVFRFSPLMVTPYVIAAGWTGYLVGLIPHMLTFSATPRDLPVGLIEFELSVPARRQLAALLMVLAVGAVGTAGMLHFRVSDGRSARVFNRFAELIADECRGRDWLISAGPFEDLIALAMVERGHSFRMMNLPMSRNRAYLRYVASRFEDPRLKGLAEVGLDTLISEWFKRDASVMEKVAVLDYADLWRAGGRVPVPGRLVYGAAATVLAGAASSGFSADTGATELEALCESASALPEPWRSWASIFVRHAGRVANDRGVLLEDAGRVDEARRAYELARRLDKTNVSAWINLVAQAQRQERPEAATLTRELEAYLEEQGAKVNLALIVRHFGYIRQPQVLVGLGLRGAVEGRGWETTDDLQRAADLHGKSATPELKLLLAGALLAEGRTKQSRELLDEVLRERPEHPGAVFALARLEMREGRYAEADARLARLPRNQVGLAVRVDVARALLKIIQGGGDPAAAVAQLQRTYPDNMEVWTLAQVLAVDRGDTVAQEKSEEAIKRLGRRPPASTLALATVAIREQKLGAARRLLDELVKETPTFRPAWETLLKLDFQERRQDLAEQHVHALLRVDPGNPVGNQFLASLQTARGEHDLARASLEAALARVKTGPLLNDLAWALHQLGQDEAALARVRESIKLAPGRAATEDTLIAILLRLGKLDEAREELDRAQKAHPTSTSLKARRAELEAARSR